MRFLWASVLVAAVALGSAGCSDESGGGGEVNSDAALRGLMQTVALDFASVLGEVAPSLALAAEKADGNMTTCPEGGTATWTESSMLGSGGSLALAACAMRGINLTGDLAGFLESDPGFVHATMLRGLGPLTVAGSYSASLNVQRLDISSNIPPTDELTYWEIHATTAEAEPLCAWSGSASCDDIPLF